MERFCEDDGPNDTGTCAFGLKTQNFFMSYFMNANTEKERLLSGISTFRAFSFWMMSGMLEAMFMFTVCVAPDINTCEFATIADQKKIILLEMQDAFSEVIGNLGRIEDCIAPPASRSLLIASTARDKPFEICRQDPSGQVVVPTELGYYKAIPVKSVITELKADEVASDTTQNLQDAIGTIDDIASDLFDAIPFTTALKGIAGILNIATFFLGKQDTDITQTLIINNFNRLRLQLTELSETIQQGFLGIKTSIADAQFDNLMGRLVAIDKAHERFMDAFDSDSSAGLKATESLFIKNKYAEEFR
jgi:hypothetical protein